MSSRTGGRNVFISYDGVNYLIDKYLSDDDRADLKALNDGFHDEEFVFELEQRIVRNSGGKNFIPTNYEMELVENAKAIIGTPISRRRLKTIDRSVDVISRADGKEVYQDSHGRWRDYRTGRYTKVD